LKEKKCLCYTRSKKRFFDKTLNMGPALSISKAVSEQRAEAYLSQQFYGSCNITCENIESGINIDIINSVIGGDINLTQKCAVDASCMVNNSSDATSDVMFKASNSTNAKNASSLFAPSLFSFDSATSESRQDIKETIIQNTTETCKMASLNQMTDVNILAANSRIGGSINLSQDGSVQGRCQLKNNFSAATTATAMATNKATSGKEKKGDKKGGALGSVVGIIVIMVIVFIAAKMFTGGQKKKAASSAILKAAEAKGMAGCPGGGKPVMDPKTGKAIIDPKTMTPICPPIGPVAPSINVNLGDILSKSGLQVSRTRQGGAQGSQPQFQQGGGQNGNFRQGSQPQFQQGGGQNGNFRQGSQPQS